MHPERPTPCTSAEALDADDGAVRLCACQSTCRAVQHAVRLSATFPRTTLTDEVAERLVLYAHAGLIEQLCDCFDARALQHVEGTRCA